MTKIFQELAQHKSSAEQNGYWQYGKLLCATGILDVFFANHSSHEGSEIMKKLKTITEQFKFKLDLERKNNRETL